MRVSDYVAVTGRWIGINVDAEPGARTLLHDPLDRGVPRFPAVHDGIGHRMAGRGRDARDCQCRVRDPREPLRVDRDRLQHVSDHLLGDARQRLWRQKAEQERRVPKPGPLAPGDERGGAELIGFHRHVALAAAEPHLSGRRLAEPAADPGRRVGALGARGHLKVDAETRQLLLAIVLRENPPWHVAADDIERPATAAIKTAFAETRRRQGRRGQDVALQVGIAERDDRIAVRRDGGEPGPELQRVAPRQATRDPPSRGHLHPERAFVRIDEFLPLDERHGGHLRLRGRGADQHGKQKGEDERKAQHRAAYLTIDASRRATKGATYRLTIPKGIGGMVVTLHHIIVHQARDQGVGEDQIKQADSQPTAQ